METNHNYDPKILDPDLIKFAEQTSTGTVSVIVELSIENTPIELTGSQGNEGRPYESAKVDGHAERQKMDRLEFELKRLAAGGLVRLNTAQAFVVDLTPDQLRAVSLLAETECVRPNRTHQIGHIK